MAGKRNRTPTLLTQRADDPIWDGEELAKVRSELPDLAAGVTPAMVDAALQRWARKHQFASKVLENNKRYAKQFERQGKRMAKVAAAAAALHQVLKEADRYGDGFLLTVVLQPNPPTLVGYDFGAEWERLRELTAAVAQIEALARATLPTKRAAKRGPPVKTALRNAIYDLGSIYAEATGRKPGRSDRGNERQGPFERFVRAAAKLCGWSEATTALAGLIDDACEEKAACT